MSEEKYLRDIMGKIPLHHKLRIQTSAMLSTLREAEGLSQRELAKRLSTSHSQINRYENPSYDGHKLKTVAEIAELLGYTIEIKFKEK